MMISWQNLLFNLVYSGKGFINQGKSPVKKKVFSPSQIIKVCNVKPPQKVKKMLNLKIDNLDFYTPSSVKSSLIIFLSLLFHEEPWLVCHNHRTESEILK